MPVKFNALTQIQINESRPTRSRSWSGMFGEQPFATFAAGVQRQPHRINAQRSPLRAASTSCHSQTVGAGGAGTRGDSRRSPVVGGVHRLPHHCPPPPPPRTPRPNPSHYQPVQVGRGGCLASKVNPPLGSGSPAKANGATRGRKPLGTASCSQPSPDRGALPPPHRLRTRFICQTWVVSDAARCLETPLPRTISQITAALPPNNLKSSSLPNTFHKIRRRVRYSIMSTKSRSKKGSHHRNIGF